MLHPAGKTLEGERGAPGGEGTGGALGITGGAGVAAVEDEPVMGYGTELRCNVFFQILFYCIRCGSF